MKKPKVNKPDPGPLNASRMYQAWAAFGRAMTPGVVASLFSLIADLEHRLRKLEQRADR
jgi:hypothetical protein